MHSLELEGGNLVWCEQIERNLSCHSRQEGSPCVDVHHQIVPMRSIIVPLSNVGRMNGADMREKRIEGTLGRRGGERYTVEKRREEYLRSSSPHYCILLHWGVCGIGEVYGTGVVDKDVDATKPGHSLVDGILQL